MSLNKQNILILAGIMWGITGFAIELVSGDGAQSAFRLVFIIISSTLLLSAIEVRLSEKFYYGLAMLTLYIIVYIISNIYHQASATQISRSLILYFLLIILYMLLSNEEHFENFLKGLFLALCGIVIFYAANIDFASIFQSDYRLMTMLNPNGIGMMANMLFIFLYYYLLTSDGKFNKLLLITMTAICIVVIVATHSRTALFMLLATFIFINIQFKKWITLILLAGVFSILFAVFYDEIATVLRLKNDADYMGSKNITNLTGRTDLWVQAYDLVLKNFFFGVGPNEAYAMVDGHKSSYHNALVQIVVTSGVLGLLPILAILFVGIINLFALNKGSIFKLIFLVGLAGSMTEDRLLNYGSPGNLLYLISFLYMGQIFIKSYSSNIIKNSQ